jgi:iron complex outermembrane receptor protein
MLKIRLTITCAILFFSFHVLSQEIGDSTKQLETIVVKGFESNVKSLLVPASISSISEKQLKKYSTFSMLPAFNAIPGVRMEERSPGSYRFSIRGSLIRSPFGVRNVKVYLNDFILTDAGGNTYINMLDINNIGGVEVLKGPSGSLYGAGTGGTLLFSNQASNFKTISDTAVYKMGIASGSYGKVDQYFSYIVRSKYFSAEISQGHNQSDGYRQQSRMRKDNIQMHLKSQLNPKESTEAILMLSDLYYQTPGGLTSLQYAANPRQARPASAVTPSALSQHTAIFNKTALLGITNTKQMSLHWRSVSSLTTSFTGFKNPFITNFEKRNELNLGLRSQLIYENKSYHAFKWITGYERQKGLYKIDSSGNNKGISDGNNVIDKILAKQSFLFSQVNIDPFSFLHIQSGISYNGYRYELNRTKGLPANGNVLMKFNRQLLPRFAAMLDVHDGLGFFYQISKGYSAPSIAEVRPSAGGIYSNLQAEQGWNSEFGVKSALWQNRLLWNFSWFDFRLKDAIIRQTNAAGAEYFVNAGSTIQKGFETDLSLIAFNKPSSKILQQFKFSASYANNHFSFKQYTIGNSNYAGKMITGVPHEIGYVSIETAFLKKLYVNCSINYISSTPLNDANTAFASTYRLWQVKTGFKSMIHKKEIEIFYLMDNPGNAKYSLGNDLNAFGSRYYNAAPLFNFTTGVNVSF